MSTLLDGIFILGLLLSVPAIFFIIEVFTGLKKAAPKSSPVTDKTCVILIPAHDEEAVLAHTLQSVKSDMGPADRIVVIADNCSDRTAAIAREMDCEAIERHDLVNRGKGHALAHGIAHLRPAPPDIAIIVDADCEVSAGTIAGLKQACLESGKPVQAKYLMFVEGDVPPERRVSEFAIYLKNHVRVQGLARLNGSVPITGSGFAVPFRLLETADLATGEIVEDMKLGLELALAGAPVQYLPHASITSPLPTASGTADMQRQRWEHGHIGMIINWLPKLLKGAFTKGSWPLLMTALDMSVLPLTLLLAFYFLLWFVGVVIAVAFGDLRLFALTTAVTFTMVIALLAANASADRAYFRWSDLAAIPRYAGTKVALYRSLLTGKRSGWVKSKRGD